MLSISTTWNFARHGTLTGAVDEIAAMGFPEVELRAQGAVPDLLSGGAHVKEKRLRCRSVHMPLTPGPWADGDPTKRIASPNEMERAAAVSAVLAGLPAAAAAGATFMVLHLGEVDVPNAKGRQKRWMAALDAGESVEEEVRAGLEERRALRDAHLEAAARSLFELRRAEPNVTWAVENRLYFHEIPSIEEMELLHSDAGKQGVAHWHDTGHAHMWARLGIAPAMDWLERCGRFTDGYHLHDAVGGQDHLPPGTGEIDWAGIRHYTATGQVRVIEVHQSHSAQAILMGADFLRTQGIG